MRKAIILHYNFHLIKVPFVIDVSYLNDILLAEMTPRIVAEAFYNGELENELRRIGRIEFRMLKDSDRDGCMEMIEELRRQTVYPHGTCTPECKKRGNVHV